MALGNLIKGDDWKFTGTVLTPGGTVQDITGGAVWLTFKDQANIGQADSSAVFQVKNLSIGADQADDPDNDPTNGVVVLRAAWDAAGVSPPDWTLVPSGTYNYDFQYMHTDGTITTVEMGTVSVVAQITNATS